MAKFIKKILNRCRDWMSTPTVEAVRSQNDFLQSQNDFLMSAQLAHSISTSKNALNRFGAKYFSQSDEDGITLEIIRRLGIKDGTFAEFGVGNGFENNTLVLLANGWRGFWVGGEGLDFNHRLNPQRFCFLKDWVTLQNLAKLVQQGCDNIATKELDVLSLDLDGNDYYFVQELLKIGVRPKLFILEYNAKFPPPIKWTIGYDADHVWDGTDYQGASLASFNELLSEHSYTLVCCNAATGVNAFFIKNEFISQFPEVPKNIMDIYIECRYQLYRRWGHQVSPRTVERMLLSARST